MSTTTLAPLALWRVGERVQLPPHRDEWMAGDRYAVVERVSLNGRLLKVRLEKSGRVIYLPTV